MQIPEVNLVGFFVDGCLVDSVLSDGPFASVFSALTPTDERVAIKVAKLKDEQYQKPELGVFYTKALAISVGGAKEVKPDREDIIKRQAEALLLLEGTALVSVKAHNPNSVSAQYMMPFIEGHTLREQIKSSKVLHGDLMQLCRAMSVIEKHSQSAGHNDLKPENIMLHPDGGITLLDPGYFGPLKYLEGGEYPICITTPEYYPYLEPLDKLAFGYILWESMCGIHPLVRPLSTGIVNEHVLGSTLIELIESQALLGNHLFESLRWLPLPSAANLNIAKDTERILLKAIGLLLTHDNKLETTEFFESFDELYEALGTIEAPQYWETAYRATHLPAKREYRVEPDSPFGIKGLFSVIGGRTDHRPFRFGSLPLFSSTETGVGDKLSCMAWQVDDRVSISVNAGKYSDLYFLAGLFAAPADKPGIYLLLKHPPEVTDESSVTTYFIARAETAGALQSLSASEFTRVSEDAVKVLEVGLPFDSGLLERALGSIQPG